MRDRRLTSLRHLKAIPIVDDDDVYIPEASMAKKDLDPAAIKSKIIDVINSLISILENHKGGAENSIYNESMYGKMNKDNKISVSYKWDFLEERIKYKVPRPEEVVLELTFSDEELEESGEYVLTAEVRREINLNPKNKKQNKRTIIVDKQIDRRNASLFFPEHVFSVDVAEKYEKFADNLIEHIKEKYRKPFVDWAAKKVTEAYHDCGKLPQLQQ